jgi:hypothetical protein
MGVCWMLSSLTEAASPTTDCASPEKAGLLWMWSCCLWCTDGAVWGRCGGC